MAACRIACVPRGAARVTARFCFMLHGFIIMVSHGSCTWIMRDLPHMSTLYMTDVSLSVLTVKAVNNVLRPVKEAPGSDT
jgi:hypothetical protein